MMVGEIRMPSKDRSTPYYPPPEAEGGWRSLVPANETPTATEKRAVMETTGLDWDRLRDAWEYCGSFGEPNSLLVIRHGWIAGEWMDYADARGIASCSKSLTSLALAKLFDLSDHGQISKRIGLEEYAYLYLPPSWSEADPRRTQIRLRHMMTMTSGLVPYDGPYNDDYPEIVLTQPVEGPPGVVWAYASVPVDLLSLVIESVSGRTLQAFFNEEIGRPIGGAPSTWVEFDGHTRGSGGARFTARELARVGYLMLRHGSWDDGSGPRPIVSAGRVAQITHWASWLEATHSEGPTSTFFSDHGARLFHGYLWWTNRNHVPLGSTVPADAFLMAGWGRQICIIIPSLDMVVVRLGANGKLNQEHEYFREMMARVMAAVAIPA
jgi:CubicO group peptidase (beta-lactamase class C family)